MAPPEIPPRIRALLAGSEFEAQTIELADAVGVVLADNETPFFPAYTDHGTEHVERVLGAIEKLIPEEVWDLGLLTAHDGCVLSSAVLLHDLAMHVREAGFVELVSSGTRYLPRPWFSSEQVDRPADLPWPELWSSFQSEARHLGTSEIELMLGQYGNGIPALAHADQLEPEGWTISDRLLIGEFLRRHHARLAHEIAIFGFPGAEGAFPILAERLPDLAEPIGAVARSHNESLRTMVAFLDYLQHGSKRPAGALLHFHMALLRVADFLQIEADRAPPLLMRLKSVQSPRSVEEWNQHGAVSSIIWEHADDMAIYVTASAQHGLRTHLALEDLLAEMQRELDTSVAVLSEAYGSAGDLAPLGLSRQRVLSNLEEPSLREQLPYLPRRASLRSDADLFRLVIKDLYGNQPAVAGRELVQNAVDAVRARRVMETQTGSVIPAGELADLESDVVVTLEVDPQGNCVLRVCDRGIGMTPELAIDYFLKAGASFGPTAAELGGMDPNQLAETMKVGRFGVGAFAAFLLGEELQVKTRHVGAEKAISFVARIDEDLVRLDWAEGPVGTEISIPFHRSVLPKERYGEEDVSTSARDLLESIARFFRLRDPSVSYRLIGGEEEEEERFAAPADVPAPHRKLPDRWRSVKGTGMDAVLWRVPRRSRYGSDEFNALGGGLLAHNGVLIHDLKHRYLAEEQVCQWSDATLSALLRLPSLAVFDARHLLPVALHRYGLVETTLPFEHQLLESIGRDIVAHSAVAGPRNHPLQDQESFSPVYSRSSWMPLLPGLLAGERSDPLLVLWRPGDRFWGLSHTRPNVDGFLSARGFPWRDFGRRCAIATEPHGAEEYELDEIQAWDHPLAAVRQAVESWRLRLDASRAATVVVRGQAPEADGGPEPIADDEFAEPEWRSYGQELGSPGVFLAGGEATDPDLEAVLVRTALQFHAINPAPSTALSVFSGFSGGNPLQASLANPWSQAVGRGMERGPRKRRGVADALAKESAVLRPLIRKWRRSISEVD